MPSPFIPDGYTRETTIPASAQWDEIHLVYRPMATSDAMAYTAKTKGLDDAGWTGFICDLLSEKIVSWSILGPDGVPVMVTPANVRRLVNPLVLRLWNIVSGVDVGDSTKN